MTPGHLRPVISNLPSAAEAEAERSALANAEADGVSGNSKPRDAVRESREKERKREVARVAREIEAKDSALRSAHERNQDVSDDLVGKALRLVEWMSAAERKSKDTVRRARGDESPTEREGRDGKLYRLPMREKSAPRSDDLFALYSAKKQRADRTRDPQDRERARLAFNQWNAKFNLDAPAINEIPCGRAWGLY